MPVPPSGGSSGASPADRPEHRHRDLVDAEAIAGDQSAAFRGTGTGESLEPCRVPGPGPARAGFVDLPDAVPLQEPGQAGDVVLVGMRQDDGVDPPVPRWQAAIEGDQQPGRVRASVHEEPPTIGSFDEDRVALADVQDGDPRDPGGTRGDDRAGHQHGDSERRAPSTRVHRPAAPRGRRVWPPRRERGVQEGPRRAYRPRPGSVRPEPPVEPHDQARRHDGGQDIERGAEGDAGERKARAGVDDRDRDPQEDPGRRRQDGPDGPRRSSHDQPARDERNEPAAIAGATSGTTTGSRPARRVTAARTPRG